MAQLMASFNLLRGGINFNKDHNKRAMKLFESKDVAVRPPTEDTSAAKELDFFGDNKGRSEEGEGKDKKRKANDSNIEATPAKKSKKLTKQLSGKKIKAKSADHTQSPAQQQSWIEAVNLLRKEHSIKVAGGTAPAPLRSFSELETRFGARKFLLDNLTAAGFSDPTPIQRQASTVLLTGQELLACAPTGSGKTLAFLIPIVVKLQKHKPGGGVRALMLSPTRELALQLARQLGLLLKGRGKTFRICTLSKANAGSTDFAETDILFATPARLSALIQEEKVDLSNVEFMVMDEADKLFEMGFMEQIDATMAACSNDKIQHALFSATLPETVEELARSVMPAPVRVTIGERNQAAGTIEQELLFVGQEEGKLLAVRQLVKAGKLRPPVMVFVQSKERARDLYNELRYDKMNVGVIHADMSATARTQAVDKFRAGETWFLIATDLLARGMDFIGVNSVVNFDFPESAISYIHRIGRSGRAGRAGFAVTLFTEEDAHDLRTIANVMVASGCPVPAWMLTLKKGPRKRNRYRPERSRDDLLEEEEQEEPSTGDGEDDGGAEAPANARTGGVVKHRKVRKKGSERSEKKDGTKTKSSISTIPKFDLQQKRKKKQIIAQSKQKHHGTA